MACREFLPFFRALAGGRFFVLSGCGFLFFDVRPLPAHGSLPEVGFGHKNPLPPFLKRVLHQINDFEAEDFIDISITLPGLSGDISADLVGFSMKTPDGADDGFSLVGTALFPFGAFLGFSFGLSFGRVGSKHLLGAEVQKLLFGKSLGGGGFSFHKGILFFRQ